MEKSFFYECGKMAGKALHPSCLPPRIDVVKVVGNNWKNQKPAEQLRHISAVSACARSNAFSKIDMGSVISPKTILQGESHHNFRVTYSFPTLNNRSLIRLLRARDKREDSLKIESAVRVRASKVSPHATKKALQLINEAKRHGLLTRIYISNAFDSDNITKSIAPEFRECDQIVLSGNSSTEPEGIYNTCTALKPYLPLTKIALRLCFPEDDSKQWRNTCAGLLANIRTFDTQNFKVVRFLEGLGIRTNWDPEISKSHQEEGSFLS